MSVRKQFPHARNTHARTARTHRTACTRLTLTMLHDKKTRNRIASYRVDRLTVCVSRRPNCNCWFEHDTVSNSRSQAYADWIYENENDIHHVYTPTSFRKQHMRVGHWQSFVVLVTVDRWAMLVGECSRVRDTRLFAWYKILFAISLLLESYMLGIVLLVEQHFSCYIKSRKHECKLLTSIETLRQLTFSEKKIITNNCHFIFISGCQTCHISY